MTVVVVVHSAYDINPLHCAVGNLTAQVSGECFEVSC